MCLRQPEAFWCVCVRVCVCTRVFVRGLLLTPCHRIKALSNVSTHTPNHMLFHATGYSPNDPHFFGRRLKIEDREFYSGGAGTILSQQALRKLGDEMTEDVFSVLSTFDTFADDM